MLVEDTRMGDWLRTGKQGVAELLISSGHTDVCALAKWMKESGQAGAPIFKEVVAMCREKRSKRGVQKHATHDQSTHGARVAQVGDKVRMHPTDPGWASLEGVAATITRIEGDRASIKYQNPSQRGAWVRTSIPLEELGPR